MKKLFKKINRLDRRIQEINAEAENLTRLPFFKTFKKEKELQEDLEVLDAELNRIRAKRVSLLEELRNEIDIALL